MDQNLNLYRIFYETAKQGNISRAAEALYISQPAVSKSITKLEQSLGHTLFIRSKRGVKLTEEGQTLFFHLKNAFESIENAEQTLQHMSRFGMGQLRIGVSTSLCKYVLLPYLQNFIDENPHVKISIECNPTYETIKLLKQDKIDIGLVCDTEFDKGFHFFPIRSIQDTFVTTQTYLDNLTLREADLATDMPALSEKEILEKCNLMLLDKENISRIYIDSYLNAHQIHPSQILEINNMDLLIDFATIGMGVACVIREFVSSYIEKGQVIEIPIDFDIPARRVGFLYNEHALSTTAQNFLATFSSL